MIFESLNKTIIVGLFVCLSSFANAQLDHWETAIFSTDNWKYFVGSSEPPSTWNTNTFNATTWSQGKGGFGYGDNDDNTTITTTSSVYIRTTFNVSDKSLLKYLVLHADYDDGFVAYINGKEIARSNISGSPPTYSDFATTLKEAQVYSGGSYEDYLIKPDKVDSLLLNGLNCLAIQIHNSSITSTDLSSNFNLSVGIANNSINYRPTASWFTPPFFSTNLPLLIVKTLNGAVVVDEPKVMASMGIVNNNVGLNTELDSANEYDGLIGIEIRGASSQIFPKKGYSVETRLADSSNNNVSLLGLPKENDWILHGPYADKSLLRNTLAYHLGGKTNLYTPRTRLCELILNDEYQGLYVLTEKIKRDKNRVDIKNLKPEDIDEVEITGGYIFQIDRDDPNSSTDGWWTSSSPGKFVSYYDPKHEELNTLQKDYLRTFFTSFETTMNGPAFRTHYTNFIDVESWVDYFLVTEMAKHIDAYKLSFFMHKKHIDNGGKLNFGPLWDFNLGFGNFDFACSPEPDGWTYEFQGTCDMSHPFWVKKLMVVPEIKDQINCRWNELRKGPYSTDSLLQFIDTNVKNLTEVSERNFEKWPVLGKYVWPNYYVGDNYTDEIKYLKDWLVDRLEWMDDNMIGECRSVSTNKFEKVEPFNLNTFPNPASDVVYTEHNQAYLNLQVTDVLGKLVKEVRVENGINKVDVSSLQTGIYFFTYIDPNGLSATKRVLIDR